MQFIKPGINLNIIGKKNIGFIISLAALLISVASLVIHSGPNLGVDFVGGTLIQIKFTEPVTIDDVKKGLANANFNKPSVQQFGDAEDNEYLIRLSKAFSNVKNSEGANFAEEIQTAIKKSTGNTPDIRRVEMVGPQVGKDLREKALFAMFYSLLFITIYISGRFEMKWLLSAIVAGSLIGAVYFLTMFNVSIPFLIVSALIVTLILFWFLELKYAMGAIVALIHDVTLTVGIFSLLNIEFSLPIIAALLTIIGYSLNDTIIVFDRIRENTRKSKKISMDLIINKSINETLSRTLLTSLTTLIVLVSLYLLGGSIIHDFALAMILGVVIGTYSSVFVASPILLAWQKNKD